MSQCCTSESCKDMLCRLINAYTALVSGQGVQEVEFEGDKTRYHLGNVTELKGLIARLHTTCGNEVSAAIVGVSPRGRAPARVCFGESYPCRLGC